MKIEVVPVSTMTRAGRQKYADIYTQIDALAPDQALRITFDDAAEAGRFKNATLTRFPRDQWDTVRQGAVVSVWRRRTWIEEPPPAPDQKA